MCASPSTRLIRDAARARLTAAAVAATPQLPDLFQTVPNPSKAPQRAPSPTKLQNEPTGHSVAGAFPQFPRSTTVAASSPDSPCQTVPISSKAPHLHPNCKTNPSHPPPSSIHHPPSSSSKPPRPLTPAQLRAARLLVAGQSTNAIAAALRIERHTLSRWKRRPDFQHELRQLIDQVASPQ